MTSGLQIHRCRLGTEGKEKEAPSLGFIWGERDSESCILFKLEQDKVESQISIIFLVIFLL